MTPTTCTRRPCTRQLFPTCTMKLQSARCEAVSMSVRALFAVCRGLAARPAQSGEPRWPGGSSQSSTPRACWYNDPGWFIFLTSCISVGLVTSEQQRRTSCLPVREGVRRLVCGRASIPKRQVRSPAPHCANEHHRVEFGHWNSECRLTSLLP